MAKAVNFGYLYGMYPDEVPEVCQDQLRSRLTMAECEVSRQMYFEQFSDWSHGMNDSDDESTLTIKLPPLLEGLDISLISYPLIAGSRWKLSVRRSTHPSKVLRFGSHALLLVQLDPRLDPRECAPVMTLHDGIGFECKEDKVDKYLPLIKETMETLPLQRTFGLELRVPIAAEVEYDTHWSGNPDASGLGFS
jgi:DNA polymerase I-like protein with 3'-5' exonuclease and polymerase domains